MPLPTSAFPSGTLLRLYPGLRRRGLGLLAAACLSALQPAAVLAQASIPAPAASGAAPAEGTPPRARTGLDAPLPALGDINSQTLSPAAERRLGDRIMRSIVRDPSVIDDPQLLAYVGEVWRALLASARARGDIGPDLDETYAWRPFLVRERSVNAFALPGGYIGVHLGLLAVTRTGDELASVLAHELSHVTQRHIARMMSQSKQQSLVGLAALVLGALAASRSPQAAQAMIMGGQGLATQGYLNFSRDMEREADRVGFALLGEAGYSPAGMAQMFEQLQLASRLNDDGSYPYLRTHPLTTERIGEARARLGMQGWARPAASPAGRERLRIVHALMSARARVLADVRSATLQGWLRPIDPPTEPVDRLAHHYLRLVAATQLHDRALGEQALALARKEAASLPPALGTPARQALIMAEAELALETGRPALVRGVLGLDPAAPTGRAPVPPSRAEIILLARAALALPDGRGAEDAVREAAQEAVNLLQPQVASQPDDATAWSLLSGAWARLGQPLRSIRAEAEASAASGDLQGAIDRVEGARRRYMQPRPADLIELSVMDARVRQWRLTMREDSRDELN